MGPILVVGEMVITAFWNVCGTLLGTQKQSGGWRYFNRYPANAGCFRLYHARKSIRVFISLGSKDSFYLEWVGVLVGCLFGIVAISNWMRDYAKDGVYDLNQGGLVME